MVDKELLQKKIKLQTVRNILKTVNGVKILCIYENGDPILERITESFSDMGYYSYEKQPDSKISVKSDALSIYQWIIENMKIKNDDILFLLCEGIWVKIQIIEVISATQSLWNNIDTQCKGFTILNEKADKLLEVGNDSRDEWNYLFNEYSIAKFQFVKRNNLINKDF